MKFVVGMKAVVINVKDDEFTDRDGKAVKTYKVAIEQNGEVGSFPCTEDVFKNAKRLEENNLFGEYVETAFNGKVDKRLRITGVSAK